MITSNNEKKDRESILGYPVDILSYEEAFQQAKNALSNKNAMHVVTLNPEMIIRAQKLTELSSCIKSAELIIPDGVGILLALWLKGKMLSKTVPGIELSEKLIEYCANNDISVAFLGAKQEILSLMITKLQNKYNGLKISTSYNGYYKPEDEETIAHNISKYKPGLVLIALGVPKQELWIKKYKRLFPESILIGVGGSFDVWSGNVKRAPKLFRMLKLEWLYRLISEPFRAKRIFSSLPYFVWQLLTAKNRNTINLA